MWQRVLGFSDKLDNSSSSARRKEESRPQRKASESAASSSTTRKQSRGDDRDRGFDLSSTKQSSAQSPHVGDAEASTYRTAQSCYYEDDSVGQPNPSRRASLSSNMPRTRSERDDRSRDGDKDRKRERRRERSSSRDRKGHGRDRSRSEERSSKSDKRKVKRRSTDPAALDSKGSARAGEMDRFSSQIGGAGFSQFPGQFDAGLPNAPGSSQRPLNHISDHVPDMFPGQFPAGAAAPYRPPVAKTEGGPGLASEYYGDAGQSVADQPGVRMHSPNLIVGTEPHLMMASSVAAPPPEPSSMGQQGSAAAFFNSESSFQTPNASPRPAPQDAPRPRPQGAPYTSSGALSPGLPPQLLPGQSISISPMTSSSAVPTLGAAAAGAAAGYAMGHHSTSQQISGFNSYEAFGPQELPGSDSPLPPSGSTRPPKPGKYPSSNVPLAAAAAGAAGLAASVYHQHQSHQNSYQYSHGSHLGNPMAHRHRDHSPFGKFVDFFRDPDGVAQFEEYTEYIGVCRGCFEPGSSPRDAPRKHHYRRRRSSEKLGTSTRVDKENRYYVSSDEERRRRNKKSWLAATAAGVGLTSVGRSLFGDPNDFQDTYSVKSGRINGSTNSLPRRSSHSRQNFYTNGEARRQEDVSSSRKSDYGVTVDGDMVKRVSQKPPMGDSINTAYIDRKDSKELKERRRSRSRSRERDHKLRDAAIGAAAGAAVASAVSHKRTSSPDDKSRQTRRESHRHDLDKKSHNSRHSSEALTGIVDGFGSSSQDRRRAGRKKKQEKGFFNFGNGSSSSSDGGLAFGAPDRRNGSKRKSSPKIKSDAEAKAALIGLGAAAATLAAHESHAKSKANRGPGVVTVKDTKGKHRQYAESKHGHKHRRPRSDSLEEEDLWESASEDGGYSSVDSALAFGISRQGSRESLAGSGTDKWDWRWGNKKPRRPSREGRENHFPTQAAAAGIAGAAAGAAFASREHYQDPAMQSMSSLPSMQHVYPVPTSDPTSFDVVRHDQVASRSGRPAPVPIQQPRPIAPVPSTMYTQLPHDQSFTASSGPQVFSQAPAAAIYNRGDRYHGSIPSAFQRGDDLADNRKYKQWEPSPPRAEQKASRSGEENSTVRFGLTREQEERQRKDERRERRKSDKYSSEAERREHEEQLILDRANSDPKRSSGNYERDSEKQDAADRKTNRERKERRAQLEGELDQDPSSRRYAEIEQELQKLIQEEPPASKPRERSEGHGVEYALAGAAVGAAAAALARDSKRSDERREKRRDGRRREDDEFEAEAIKGKADEKPKRGFASIVGAALASEEPRGRKETAETIVTIEPHTKTPEEEESRDLTGKDRRDRDRRTARQGAAKVRIATRSPSPAAYESYASYFAPDDILSKPAGEKQRAADPNADADITTFNVTVDPPKFDGQYVAPEIPTFADQELGLADIHQHFPWKIPPLNLIYPTPAASRAGSIAGSAQPSPIIAPRDEVRKEVEEVSELSRKVSFGDNQTHEYEVITPEDHRDEFISSPPDVSRENIKDQARPPKSPITPADVESPVEEIARSSMPGMFDDDPEFAATLAAGVEAAGFDPEIVIDDPMYRRRDSPPGSQERRGFYTQPFYETVSDIAVESPRSRGAPPQRGWVEDTELPETPKDAMSQSRNQDNVQDSDPDLSRKERRKREKAAKKRAISDEPEAQKQAATKDYTDPDDAELEIIEDAAQETSETFTPANSKKSKRKSKRDSTYESAPSTKIGIDNNHGNASDELKGSENGKQGIAHAEAFDFPNSPEDNGFRDLPSSAEKEISNLPEEDLYESPNEYAASAASAPLADERTNGKKGKKKSKRRSTGLDDTASVASAPAKIEETPKSKSKKKGGLFGLFGKAPEEEIETHDSKALLSKDADEFEEPKKKGKKSRKSRDDYDFYDVASEPAAEDPKIEGEEKEEAEDRKSRKARKEEKRRSRQDAIEDEAPGRRSRDLSDKGNELDSDGFFKLTDIHMKQHEPESFLGARQEETEPPDILRGTRDPGGGTHISPRRSSSSPPTSRPATPPKIDWTKDNAFEASESSPTRSRRLSMFQTDSLGSPMTPSPTAVPLPFMFRRPPSAGLVRSSSATPMASPSLSTPRTRRPRPLSTEFRTNEIRPLWLLERHQSKQEFDPNEVLPSLPSSQSGSRASSVHEGDAQSRGRDEQEPKFKGEPIDIGAARDYEHDVLDSQQTTPTAASYKSKSEQDRREKTREREQDLIAQATQESLAKEHEWNSRHSKELEQHRKSDGSSHWVDAGLAALAGGAAAVALTSLAKHDRHTLPNEQVQEPSELSEEQVVADKRELLEKTHPEYTERQSDYPRPSTEEAIQSLKPTTTNAQQEDPIVSALQPKEPSKELSEADDWSGFAKKTGKKKGKKHKKDKQAAFDYNATEPETNAQAFYPLEDARFEGHPSPPNKELPTDELVGVGASSGSANNTEIAPNSASIMSKDVQPPVPSDSNLPHSLTVEEGQETMDVKARDSVLQEDSSTGTEKPAEASLFEDPLLKRADSTSKKSKKKKGKKSQVSEDPGQDLDEEPLKSSEIGQMSTKHDAGQASPLTTMASSRAEIPPESSISEPEYIPLPVTDDLDLLEQAGALETSADNAKAVLHTDFDTKADQEQEYASEALQPARNDETPGHDSLTPVTKADSIESSSSHQGDKPSDIYTSTEGSSFLPEQVSEPAPIAAENADAGGFEFTSTKKAKKGKKGRKSQPEISLAQEQVDLQPSSTTSLESPFRDPEDTAKEIAGPSRDFEEDDWTSFGKAIDKKNKNSKKSRTSVELKDYPTTEIEQEDSQVLDIGMGKTPSAEQASIISATEQSELPEDKSSSQTSPLSSSAKEASPEVRHLLPVEESLTESQIEQQQAQEDEWAAFPPKSNKKSKKAKAAAAAAAAAVAAATAISVGESDSKDKNIAFTTPEANPKESTEETPTEVAKEGSTEEEWASQARAGRKGKKSKRTRTQESLEPDLEESAEALAEPVSLPKEIQAESVETAEAPLSMKAKKKEKKRKSVTFLENEELDKHDVEEPSPDAEAPTMSETGEYDEPQSLVTKLYPQTTPNETGIETPDKIMWGEELGGPDEDKVSYQEGETVQNTTSQLLSTSNEDVRPSSEVSDEPWNPSQEREVPQASTKDTITEDSTAIDPEFSFVAAKSKKSKKGKKRESLRWDDEPEKSKAIQTEGNQGDDVSSETALPPPPEPTIGLEKQEPADNDASFITASAKGKKARKKEKKERKSSLAEQTMPEENTEITRGSYEDVDGPEEPTHKENTTEEASSFQPANAASNEEDYRSEIAETLYPKVTPENESSEAINVDSSDGIGASDSKRDSETFKTELLSTTEDTEEKTTETSNEATSLEFEQVDRDAERSGARLENDEDQGNLWPASKQSRKSKKKKRKSSTTELDRQEVSEDRNSHEDAVIASSAATAGVALVGDEDPGIDNGELGPDDDGLATPKQSKNSEKSDNDKETQWFDATELGGEPSNDIPSAASQSSEAVIEVTPSAEVEAGAAPSKAKKAKKKKQKYVDWAEEPEVEPREPDVIQYERNAEQAHEDELTADPEVTISEAEQEEFERALVEMNQPGGTSTSTQDAPALQKEPESAMHRGEELGLRAQGPTPSLDDAHPHETSQSAFEEHQVEILEEPTIREPEILSVGGYEDETEEQKLRSTTTLEQPEPFIIHDYKVLDAMENVSRTTLTDVSPTPESVSRNEAPVDDWPEFADGRKSKKSKKSKKKQAFSFDDEQADGFSEPKAQADNTAPFEPTEETQDSDKQVPMPEPSFDIPTKVTDVDETSFTHQDSTIQDPAATSQKKSKKEKRKQKGRRSDWVEDQEQVPENDSNVMSIAATATAAVAGVGAAATAHDSIHRESLDNIKLQTETGDSRVLAEASEIQADLDDQAFVEQREPTSSSIHPDREWEANSLKSTEYDGSVKPDRELDPEPDFSKKTKKGKKAKKRAQTFSWDDPETVGQDNEETHDSSDKTAKEDATPFLERAATFQEQDTSADLSTPSRKGKKGKKNKKQFIAWEEPEAQIETENRRLDDDEQIQFGVHSETLEPTVQDLVVESSITKLSKETSDIAKPDSTQVSPKETEFAHDEIQEKASKAEPNDEASRSFQPDTDDNGKKSMERWSWEPEAGRMSPTQLEVPIAVSEKVREELDNEAQPLTPTLDTLTGKFVDVSPPERRELSMEEEVYKERTPPVTSAIQVEDEQLEFPTSKPKKGKKSKKGRLSELETAEPLNIPPTGERPLPADQTVKDVYQRPSDEQLQPVEEMPSPEKEERSPDIDTFAGLGAVKRKKGKKAKKQQSVVDNEPWTPPENSGSSKYIEDDASNAYHQEPETMDDQTWERPSPGPYGDSSLAEGILQEEKTATQNRGPESVRAAAAFEAPRLLRHEDSIVPPMLANIDGEPSAQPEFTMTTGKKGKKGKKKRKEAALFEADEAISTEAAISTPLAEELWALNEVPSNAKNAEIERSSEEAAQKDQYEERSTVPVESDAPVDNWAASPAKKGKKGKKSKQRSSALEGTTAEDQSRDQLEIDRANVEDSTEKSFIQSHSRSSSLRDAAKGIGTVGAGIALFEGIHRATSISEEQPPRRKDRKDSKTDYVDAPVFDDESQQIESVGESRPERLEGHERRELEPSYRDSALHMESPMISEPAHRFETVRDSGFQDGADSIDRSLNVSVEADPHYDVTISRPDGASKSTDETQRELDPYLPSPVDSRQPSPQPSVADREPSPIHSTTKDRSAALFGSSPSTREDHQHRDRGRSFDEVTSPSLMQPKSIFGGPAGISSDREHESLRSPPKTPIDFETPNRPLTTIEEGSPEDSPRPRASRHDSNTREQEPTLKPARRSITPQSLSHHRVRSPNADSPRRLGLISTDDIISRLSWPEVDEEQHAVDLERSLSRNTDKDRRGSSSRRTRPSSLVIDPNKVRDQSRRSTSGASVRSNESINAIIKSPPLSTTGTPPLRRVDRSLSSDLRAASRRDEPSEPSLGSVDEADSEKRAKADRELQSQQHQGVASSSTYDPTKDKGKGRIVKMSDVYEGYGDFSGSPRSPTRPPSMRRRQSMQLLDLESKVDQLVSENRLLVDAKNRAERSLDQATHDHSQQSHALNEALETRDLYLHQKDEELDELKRTLQSLQVEVGRLSEANKAIGEQGNVEEYEHKYRDLEHVHNAAREQLEDQSHELEELRNKHTSLSGGMEGIVAAEVALAVQSKDAELKQLRNELELAKQQVRTLQQEIMAARRGEDSLVEHDEDYFDTKCEQLCRHVQQWVMRFSKFSDNKICRRMEEVTDEKITDRFDNAILDGTDVDLYLIDRVKRRDVFMSVVMSMVWEYIFTRYLFGMDREQRQKLKYLEKTLSEVGSPAAVNKWRATTLTMLAKREAFFTQRQQDTEAVVHEVYDTLAAFLPPPSHLTEQIQESLRKVLSAAVDLSIEMRTQKSEYIMLPPLQPEYNTNGDLETKVYFNAASMNERSGDTVDNKDLEESEAVVRIVLFPLVIKQGNDDGEEDEREVICPAQVLVAKEESGKDKKGKRSVRVMSAQGNRSQGSIAPSQMEGGYI